MSLKTKSMFRDPSKLQTVCELLSVMIMINLNYYIHFLRFVFCCCVMSKKYDAKTISYVLYCTENDRVLKSSIGSILLNK